MAERDRERLRRREGLREARLQAHYAVQWLGRLGGAFVPPQPDYSHTSLDWNDALGGFTTKGLKGGMRVGLRIAELAFVFLDKYGKRIESYPLNGRSDRDVRQMFDRILGAHGLDVAVLDKVAPYEIPAHPIAKGAAYDVGKISGFAGELAGRFGEAHSALDRIRQRMTERSFSASPVRGWPHHFDIATLISLDAGCGEHGRSVNAGLSPGDKYYDEPYFYVSPYPYPAPAALPPLSGLGHWHRRDFTAAVVTMFERIDGGNQKAATKAFLDEAVGAAMKALDRSPNQNVQP